MAVSILAAAGPIAAKAGLAWMLGPIGWIALAAVAIWGGYELFVSEMADAKAEGVKEGYESASREYEAKLRAQAQEFMKLLAKLNEEIENLRRERDEARTFAGRALSLVSSIFGSNPAEKFEKQEQELRTQSQELAEQAFTLLGNFEGCINKAEEQGIIVDDKTWECYNQLKDITNGIQANAKLTTAA